MPAEDAVEVPFVVKAETPHRGCVRLVGSLRALGEWNTNDGVELGTTPETYPRWSATVRLPADAVAQGGIEYKFVIAGPDGQVQWEDGVNRQLRSRAPASHVFAQETPRIDAPQELATSSAASGRGVVFEAVCSLTLPGDCLLVLGASPTLGAWEPSRALRLATSPTMFPHWCGAATFAAGAALGTWKLAIQRADGSLEWELGQDRVTLFSLDEGEEALVVRAAFGAAHAEHSPEAEAVKLSDLSTPLNSACLKRCGGGSSETDVNCGSKEQDVEAEGCKSLSRPSSIASTASTCASEDDGDAHLLIETKPFTKQVFEGLFPDGDLRHRLAGKVVPPQTPHEGGRPLWLWSGAHRIEKPCGRCEDAFFHSSKALGVADGVGSMVQFAKYGADAAAFAAELMENASTAVDRYSERRKDEGPDARAVAAVRAAEVQARSYGASTITVLALDEDKVGVANLGDSGFMLLRKGSEGLFIAARSQEQQHRWNCPYQLARLPPALTARLPKGERLDTAADCQRYNVEVQPGDLLLLFTDGMCDNLHEQELLEIASRALAPALSELAGLAGFATPPETVARALALAAQERSLDDTAPVPFWEASRRHGVASCLGGKPDDITVVAAWVMPEACPSASPAA